MSNQPSRFLVVNGDDFGVSPSVNRAIVAAHDRGILTSASLMVTGAAFEEAVALAKARPSLAVGLHLVLVCGQSALSPSAVPHLVNAAGDFSDQPAQAGLRYQFSDLARQELPLEIHAQLEKFRQTGLPLAHVDGHLHLHSHPVVLRHLVEFADEFQIRFIRLPSEELGLTLTIDRSNLVTKLVWSAVFGGLRRYGERLLAANGIQFSQRVYGLLQTGQITEDYLLKLIPQIRADLVEIYAHPDAETAELAALLSGQVKAKIAESGFRLTNYRDYLSPISHKVSCE